MKIKYCISLLFMIAVTILSKAKLPELHFTFHQRLELSKHLITISEFAPLTIPIKERLALLASLHEELIPYKNQLVANSIDTFEVFTRKLISISFNLDKALESIQTGTDAAAPIQRLIKGINEALEYFKETLMYHPLLPQRLKDAGRFIPIPVNFPSPSDIGSGILDGVKGFAVMTALYVAYKALESFFIGSDLRKIKRLETRLKKTTQKMTHIKETLADKRTFLIFTTDGETKKEYDRLERETTALKKLEEKLALKRDDLASKIGDHAQSPTPISTMVAQNKSNKHFKQLHKEICQLQDQINAKLKRIEEMQQKIEALDKKLSAISDGNTRIISEQNSQKQSYHKTFTDYQSNIAQLKASLKTLKEHLTQTQCAKEILSIESVLPEFENLINGFVTAFTSQAQT